MSSHLAISYSPTTAASKSSAAGGSAASTASDGLGFLGALIDQLLAGDAGEATDQLTSALTSVADTVTASATTTTSSSEVAPAKSSQRSSVAEGLKLLSRLASELRGVQFQLSAGENPDADQLQMLNLTLDRLSRILGFSLTAGQSTTNTGNASDDTANSETANDTSTLGAGLAAISTGLLANGADASADDSTTTDTNTPNSATTATTTNGAGDVQSAFANLTKALDAASAAVTALSPALAQKLEAFADQLGAVQADPQILTALAGDTEDPGAAVSAALAKLTKPLHLFSEFTPLLQLSGETQLPAPTSRGSGVTSVAEKTNTAKTLTVTTSALTAAAPDVAPTTKVRSSSGTESKSPADARIVAAETTDPDPAKADSSSASQTTTADATSGAAATAAQSRSLPAAYQPIANPINMGQVAFEMVHQVQKGLSRFSIRLDPAELGRIDVRMSVDQTGAVTARLTVDRPETLDLFQRDRTVLERALTQAGLDTSKTSLEFSLRQNPFTGTSSGGGDRQPPGTYTADSSSTVTTEGGDTATTVLSVTLYRGAATSRGVNILA